MSTMSLPISPDPGQAVSLPQVQKLGQVPSAMLDAFDSCNLTRLQVTVLHEKQIGVGMLAKGHPPQVLDGMCAKSRMNKPRLYSFLLCSLTLGRPLGALFL
jgi:hypothetical protein